MVKEQDKLFKQALKRRTLSIDVDDYLKSCDDDAVSRRTANRTPFSVTIPEIQPTNSNNNNNSNNSESSRRASFREYFSPLVSIKSHYDLAELYQLDYMRSNMCKGLYLKILILVMVVFLSAFVVAIFFEPMQHEGFVKVNGQQFELDCRPFYLVGFNTHDLMEGALVTPSHFRTEGGQSGRQLIKKMFHDASSAGLNTLRTWAHTNDAKFPFQIKPGEYDGIAFQSLDYILEESRRNGMKVILSFVDNWKYYNGVAQYVDWSTTVPARNQTRPVDQFGDPNPVTFAHESDKLYETARHILFFTDPDCKKMYKNHVKAILNRVNKFNGRRYKDDPTIMAWDLLNEPRCETWLVPKCADILQTWLAEMSSYVKSEDPNHLVTIGSEGFFGGNSEHVSNNPQEWAQDMGQDFVSNNLVPYIDYATIHVWPNNWNRTSSQFQKLWIQSHIQIAFNEIQKPLLVEEFGKKLIEQNEQGREGVPNLRDPVYLLTYELVESGISNLMGIGGSLFWRWHMPKFAGQGTGEYGVQPEDTTFPIISQHAKFINMKTNSVPPNPQCKLECWIPQHQWWGLVRKCVNVNKACNEFWSLQKQQQFEVDKKKLFYTSKRACCRLGSGAFDGKGCSWTSLIV